MRRCTMKEAAHGEIGITGMAVCAAPAVCVGKANAHGYKSHVQ
jgi:hypothetical protein